MSARLLIEIRAEELVVVRLESLSMSDELRLLDDLLHRPDLPGEIREAIGGQLKVMQARAASAVPGDADA